MQTSILRGANYAPQLKFAQKLYEIVTLKTLFQKLVPILRGRTFGQQLGED
ncbi:MAG: hypothetical protein RL028_442 [Actinomycetota bacterium]|jgi:hypothetical protein